MKLALLLGFAALVALTDAFPDHSVAGFTEQREKLRRLFRILPKPSEEEQEYCAAKFNVSHPIDVTPESSESVKCAFKCGAEKAGLWKDGYPAGVMADIKEVLDDIVGKYDYSADNVVAKVVNIRDCFPVSYVSDCEGMAAFMYCFVTRLLSTH